MTKNAYKTAYPFSVVSDEVFDLLTESECAKIIANDQNTIRFHEENPSKLTHCIIIQGKFNLMAYTRINYFRGQRKVIQVYHHNFNPAQHSIELLQKLIKEIRKVYQSEHWMGIHINLPVNFPAEQLDEKLAHTHCRYFLGRVRDYNIQLPDSYTIKMPKHSFDLIESFEEMNRKFKQKHPKSEFWEDTLWFDYWLNVGKSAVIYDAKNHPVAGVFMTQMKEFIFHYPTWQIQFIITDLEHQGKGFARILRQFASKMAFESQDGMALIGGIVGLWNTPSFKNFGINGRFSCLDRILIDRNEKIGYPRSQLSE